MSKSKPDAFIITKDGSWDLIKSSALDRYAIKADEDSHGSKQIKDDGFDYNRLYEPLYNPEQLLELLEVNTYHAQCVDVVSRDAGGLGSTVDDIPDKKSNESGKKRIREFIKGLAPNINELLYKRNYDRRSMGYGALEISREGRSKSKIEGLNHIPAQHLRRHKDGFRVKQQIGTKTVWFVIYGENKVDGKKVDVNADTGEICRYNSLKRNERANELLWRMDYTPKSQYYGLAKIVPAIGAIHGDTSRAVYNTVFFKNYGMPAFAVTVSGDFEDYDKEPGDEGYDETQTLRYKISQQIKEVMKNPHSAVTILVPSEGEEGNVEIKLQPLSVETKEASFRLYRKDNRDEVITAHRVPPYRIGINETGKLGGSNSEEATKIYKTSVIEPLQSEDESDINMLITEMFENPSGRFAISEIDVRDMAADMNIAEKLFNMAAMKPKEMRTYFGERFGLEEDKNPYLDEYYLNGVPLDQVWDQNNMTDPPGTNSVLDNLEDDLTGGLDDDGEEDDDSREDRAVKNTFNRLRQRISNAISRRKSLTQQD